MRYLQQCITDLKDANESSRSSQPMPPQPKTSPIGRELKHVEYDDDQEDEDSEMPSPEDLDTPPASAGPFASHYTSSHSSTASPTFEANSSQPPSYATSISSLPSPAIAPQHNSYDHAYSASISPVLSAHGSKDYDHEATAALLMLNQDRRYHRTSTSTNTRGMSVKDLLSSSPR